MLHSLYTRDEHRLFAVEENFTKCLMRKSVPKYGQERDVDSCHFDLDTDGAHI